MLSEPLHILFIALLLIVSFLYSSVGHGGASGYLALMALFGMSPDIMKSSALVMNIFVSLIAFVGYYKAGFFQLKLFLPFAITSIPASFLGAYMTVDALLYKRILGFILIFPILRLTGLFGKEPQEKKLLNTYLALMIGAGIGFLSGMIGIGGGIILSPIILLLHWGNMKETAALSALFILVNSISGLAGILSIGVAIDPSVFIWVGAVVIGGFAGTYFATTKFTNPTLKKILAFVLLIASVKLLTITDNK
ncbi:MAG TPA: sulfite exporter TauE/SafE family protein [Bacteroidia bacterium]|nr:sulfite exporter TauE/SafE family protein [Bacteroidia bacterium]